MDASRLKIGLTDYISALERQLVEMREQGDALRATWTRTRDVYRGEGAEHFAAAYDRSSQMLANYIETIERMLPILKDRLAALERFDSSANPGV